MKALLLLAATFALLAPAAFAQPHPSAGWAERHAGRGDLRAQEMMTDLHTILRIRPDEEGAFQAFAANMAPRGRERMQEAQGERNMTTPQLIDQMDAHKAAHDAEERQRGQAVKRFYAALSPEQQQVFDALHRLTVDHNGGWRGHGHGHGSVMDDGGEP